MTAPTHDIRPCCTRPCSIQLGGVRLVHTPPVVSTVLAHDAVVEAATAAGAAAGQAVADAVLEQVGKKAKTKTESVPHRERPVAAELSFGWHRVQLKLTVRSHQIVVSAKRRV